MLVRDCARQDQSPVTPQGLQILRVCVRFIPVHLNWMIADALRRERALPVEGRLEAVAPLPGPARRGPAPPPPLRIAALIDEPLVLGNCHRVGSGPVVRCHGDRATWPGPQGEWVTPHPERATRHPTPQEVREAVAQPNTRPEISLFQTELVEELGPRFRIR